MIYFFRILSPDHPDFICEIQVDGTSTLFTFHKAIQSACDIDESFCSFFTCDEDWNKEKEYTAVDMGIEGDEFVSMEKITLSELIVEKKQKLIYAYDIIENRSLYIEVTEFWNDRNLDMPVLCHIEGDVKAPVVRQEIGVDSGFVDELDDPYFDDSSWDDEMGSEFDSIDDLDI
ncbi:plasmid pRiA4b ORF-3 family protein [Halosquirtibacter xylanolyticus]|uniref:IS1096 element passenger TnpR family protein n=1 Tax=Halosquirtibacter xylanolyticus TaxID=3374599 RepID=UPI003749C6CA|nr:plasmid pRiA4b ORF-3 family protein [Prolixibacteraceae bacterium]